MNVIEENKKDIIKEMYNMDESEMYKEIVLDTIKEDLRTYIVSPFKKKMIIG